MVPDTSSETCLIKIEDRNNSLVSDISDSNFVIYRPGSITIICPNGGEQWETGSTQNITWISNNVDNINIYCMNENGTIVDTIATQYPDSLKSFSWIVSDAILGNCLIKIEDNDDKLIFDVSDVHFVIFSGIAINNLEIPRDYILEQNYPNPFNPQTNVEFALPRLTEVTISIINLRGQIIQVLFAGTKGPGYHSVIWDASDLPSGTYFIKMQAEGFISYTKCILLKE